MANIEIREISKEAFDKFFEKLNAEVFKTLYFRPESVYSEEEKRAVEELSQNMKNKYVLRLAAYDGEKLVAWSISAQRTADTMHTMVSAVIPEYRGQGIYKKITSLVLERAREKGFQQVTSSHTAANNAVIVPKLKAGFQITGLVWDDTTGPRVQLTYFFNPKRRRVYRFRTGDERPDQEIRDLLKI